MRVRFASGRRALGALCLSVVCSSASFPRIASAQSSSAEKAAAEALFDEGLKLLRSRQYSEACQKLETSQRIDPAIGTLLYLAECYEQLGRTASAWATFREAGSLAQSSGQSERTKIAAQRAARLEPELAYLSVSVPPESKVTGLVVTRAGDTVGPGLFGISVPADPGEVLVEASAPGRTPVSVKVTLAPRERKAVTLPAFGAAATEPAPTTDATPQTPAPAQPAAPAVAATAPPVQPTPAAANPQRTLVYVLGGAGLVGLGVGTFFGLRAINRNSEAEKTCTGSTCLDQAGVDKTNQARTAATISNVSFIAGGALLASAIVGFVLTRPKPTEHAGWTVTPALSPTTVGLTLSRSVQ